MMPAKRARIDTLLVQRGLAGSRERARRLVMAGVVFVGTQRIDKPGTQVPTDASLEVRGTDIPFVSRGGLKLDAALTHWDIDVRDVVAVDIGASTGGFTDCLLQRSARHVYAIDVGYGQFAWTLRQDARVTLFERANIRAFDPSQLPQQADLAVIDVSFISLRLVLPTTIKLLHAGGTILSLVKPQFEVGKGEVGKGGVVRDPAQHRGVLDSINELTAELGLVSQGEYLCPVPGPKGNREFFVYLSLGAR